MSARWRVERDRTETGLLHGWVAYDGADGAWFPTWSEAWRFAIHRARTAWVGDERVGMIALAFPWSRGLPLMERARFAWELTHHPQPPTDDDLERLIAEWHVYARRGLIKAMGRAS